MVASDISAWLRAQEQKDLLRFVTIGSVDDGKSTLIGRLLHDAHGLYEDQLHAVRRASVRGSTRGEGSTSEIDFSLFTDGLQAEREQGITIDVAYRYFTTERRKFIIADTPGHVQYTRNMATGASTADVALILVDARLGVLPQTRRHAQIAALLGISHVVVCVNKMDLVGFDRAIFDSISGALREIGEKLGLRDIHAIPVSALAGDNVVSKSSRTPWWNGTTVLEHLETVQVVRQGSEGSFRLPVQLVLRPGIGYRGFAGQIVSGTVRPGDELVALPSGKRARVAGVDVGGKPVNAAFAPMSVAIRLSSEIDVSRGDVLARADEPLTIGTEFQADLVWMSERPLDRAKSYLLKHTTRLVRAEIDTIVHGTDAETLSPVPKETLSLNDIARVQVRCHAPIFFDPYAVHRATGAFILIDSVTNDTVAAGMITAATRAHAREERSGAHTQVSPDERRTRLGQTGAVIRITAPSDEEALGAAYALERELFDQGRVATVVQGSREPLDAAAACARAGIFAVVAGQGTAWAAEIRGPHLEAADLEPRLEAADRDGLVRAIAGALLVQT
ncbi:sulfate adenylyltransferase subunit 1 [Pendulispora albinea]|uniref:sulfate adenylyltransferase n=1 Tax=Pendulispora albinea TaxID=2741071 RepID=A0ABZ2M985_9BACT